jgi:hypothetical protein
LGFVLVYRLGSRLFVVLDQSRTFHPTSFDNHLALLLVLCYLLSYIPAQAPGFWHQGPWWQHNGERHLFEQLAFKTKKRADKRQLKTDEAGRTRGSTLRKARDACCWCKCQRNGQEGSNITALGNYLSLVLSSSVLFCLLCFKSNAVRRPERPMQDKRKDQILSSWTEPPFETPQVHLPPNLSSSLTVSFAHNFRLRVTHHEALLVGNSITSQPQLLHPPPLSLTPIDKQHQQSLKHRLTSKQQIPNP